MNLATHAAPAGRGPRTPAPRRLPGSALARRSPLGAVAALLGLAASWLVNAGCIGPGEAGRAAVDSEDMQQHAAFWVQNGAVHEVQIRLFVPSLSGDPAGAERLLREGDPVLARLLGSFNPGNTYTVNPQTQAQLEQRAAAGLNLSADQLAALLRAIGATPATPSPGPTPTPPE